MAIIGIDQSLTGTGLAVIDNSGNLVGTRIVNTAKLRGVERLAYISGKVNEFVNESGERCIAAREGYSFGSKGRATFSLGELGGCVDMGLYKERPENLVSYYMIPPTVVKKYCLGSGAAKKDSAYLLLVYNRTGLEFPDDNQADAYMIALTLLGFLMGRNIRMKDFFDKLTPVQKEALMSSKMGKKGSGITKASMKSIGHESFASHVGEVLDGYLVF